MFVLIDLTATCNDPALANGLVLFHRVFNLVCLILPIFLIIMVIMNLVSMIIAPDDKKQNKKLINKFLAAMFIFFLPTILNLAVSLLSVVVDENNPDGMLFDIVTCWTSAKEAQKDLGEASYNSGAGTKAGSGSGGIMGDLSGLKNYTKSSSGSDGGILIIAGHSYSIGGYCSQASNECREESGMRYLEPDQTRMLARLLKSELDSRGLKSAIANEILGGTDIKMNKSFYVERRLNTADFQMNQENFKKFTHAIEIHFNATGGGAHGTLLMYSGSTSNVDQQLKSAVVKYTGRALNDISANLGNILYFKNLGIPMTYIEVEFYDNNSAMDQYTKNKEKIAKEMADVFEKNYGSKIKR